MSDRQNPEIGWRVVLNSASPKGLKGWGRVRASQIDETCRGFTVAAWGQALNAVLLVIILRESVAAHWLSLWLLLLVGLMLIANRERRHWKLQRSRAVSRRVIAKVSWQSMLFGLVWAMPAFYFFPLATDAEQIAICLVTASMMAGATFVFTTLPQASGGYVIIMGAAASNLLASTGEPVIFAIGPIYTIGLFVMALSNGREFIRRRCMELELEDRSETVSLLLREYETSDADWLWETNLSLALRHVSGRFARAIGRSVEAVEGRPILEILSCGPDADARAANSAAAFRAFMVDRAAFTGLVITVATPEGVRCIEMSARPRFNKQGRFIGYRGVGSDVTVAQQSRRRIDYMARHDALTGLPNRPQLLEELGDALGHARRTGSQCAVLLIDLDRFKAVNDTLGHVAGDHLLQQVSARFEPIMTRGMTVGRLGGDEFALVIRDARGPDELTRLCREIIEALKQPFVYNDQHLFVGASIGLAFGPRDGATVEDLVRNADLALYGAKNGGGNEICFYQPGLHARAEERRRIEVAMRGALEAGEFRLVYQPVVEVGTGGVRGCEALLRWTSAELGEISPAKFIPLAEETGLICRIGEWVLRTATAEAAAWPDDIAVAVNISPMQLQHDGFMATLVSALSQSGLAPHRLELEITETMFLQLDAAMQQVLRRIQGLGVKLAIDDFGTGYSSLGYLRNGRFDTIKIDRSFVQGVSTDDPESGAIVRTVVALAGSLGMSTVAEGVETVEEMRAVRALGCDRVQGFLIAHPQPAEEVRKLFAAGHGRIAA